MFGQTILNGLGTGKRALVTAMPEDSALRVCHGEALTLRHALMSGSRWRQSNGTHRAKLLLGKALLYAKP